MIVRRKEQALACGELVWFRALNALTTTILAGVGFEDPDKDLKLAGWLEKMKFESVLDGGASGHTPLRYAVIEGRVDLVKAILEGETKVDVVRTRRLTRTHGIACGWHPCALSSSLPSPPWKLYAPLDLP